MRVYSEAEIAQILQRAADRQAQHARTAPERGLTLAELEALAAESGLDVEHVRAAAAEVSPASPPERSRSATHVFVERTLNVPLTNDGWDELVADLQNRYGKAGMAAYGPGAAPSGTVTAVGRSREWAHTDGLGVETRVLATERGDTMRLRLSQRVGIMQERGEGLLYGLPLGALVAAVLGQLFPGAALLIWPLVLVLSVVGVYTADMRWRRSKHDQLETVSGELASVLAAHGTSTEGTSTQRRTGGATTETPRLSLDALGEVPEDLPSEGDQVPSDRSRSGAQS